ncbi:hypothetical protein D3C80_2052510 [compost metagenome]
MCADQSRSGLGAQHLTDGSDGNDRSVACQHCVGRGEASDIGEELLLQFQPLWHSFNDDIGVAHRLPQVCEEANVRENRR